MMAQVYFFKGAKNHPAVFDYFFRKLPFDGGYTVFAGLEDILNILTKIRFNLEDIEFLKKQHLNPDFINYLENFRFTGTIRAIHEGDIIFPTCPILSVEANIIEAQIIETLILNILNFQSLIATKARRMRQVAGNRKLIDFGLRRAQGVGGYFASRAAIIGGFDATSNVIAGRDYNIPVAGTMAHSFIQSYDDELDAFRAFAKEWPNDCVFLVDTYNTLESGIPNAIKVAKEMEQNGLRAKGIRLDSGDLAFLAKQARYLLDQAGLAYMKIAVSNQLDEYVIKSLLEQNAPIEVFGVGTNLVIGSPDAALDGVYKLAFSDDKPRIKLSDTLSKISLPYPKQVYRVLSNNGAFLGADAIALMTEQDVDVMYHPFEPLKISRVKKYQKQPLLHKVMENGQRISDFVSTMEIAKYSQKRFSLLPEEYKRFNNPHTYKVGLSRQLKEARDMLARCYSY